MKSKIKTTGKAKAATKSAKPLNKAAVKKTMAKQGPKKY